MTAKNCSHQRLAGGREDIFLEQDLAVSFKALPLLPYRKATETCTREAPVSGRKALQGTPGSGGDCRHNPFGQHRALALFLPGVWESDALQRIMPEISLSYRVSIHLQEQLLVYLLETLSKGRYNSLLSSLN